MQMGNLSVKWAAFFIADGVLFILLGASHYLPDYHQPVISTGLPIPLTMIQQVSGDELRAIYNYYFYGALFIALGITILLIKYARNRKAQPDLVLENQLD